MANVSGIPDALVLVQRARDILTQVTDGKIDIGITGMDLVEEYRTEGSDLFVLYEDLAFSVARVALAVPESWLDVSTLSDLADVAAALRERGDPLRVVTTFPRLTQRFLYARGITHFSIVPAEGGVEAAPGVGFGDVIVDNVETGVSLRENRLKLIRNGTILRSQACLVANRRALADSPRKRETTRQIVELIEARLRARDYYSVTANLRGASELEVARALLDAPATRGMRGPTVARVYTAQDTDGQDARTSTGSPRRSSSRRTPSSRRSTICARWAARGCPWCPCATSSTPARTSSRAPCRPSDWRTAQPAPTGAPGGRRG